MSDVTDRHVTPEKLVEDGVELGLAGYALHNRATGEHPGRHGIVGQVADLAGTFIIYGFLWHFLVVPYLIASAVVMSAPAVLYLLLIPLREATYGTGVVSYATPVLWILFVLGVIGWVALQRWWILRLRRSEKERPSNYVWILPYLIVTGAIFNPPSIIWIFAARHSQDAEGNLGRLSPGFWLLASALFLLWLKHPVYGWAYKGRWFSPRSSDVMTPQGPIETRIPTSESTFSRNRTPMGAVLPGDVPHAEWCRCPACQRGRGALR